MTRQALGANWSASVSWIATGPPQGLVLAADGAAPERIVVQANYKGASVADDLGVAILSDDGGSNWRRSAGTVPACNEGQVAPAQNGSLVMNCRTGGYHRLLSWSNDRGDSWSPPLAWYHSPSGLGSPCEGSMVRASDALLAFSNNYGVAGDAGGGCARCNMTVWTSRDSGATWLAPTKTRRWTARTRRSSRSTARMCCSCMSAVGRPGAGPAAARPSRCGTQAYSD